MIVDTSALAAIVFDERGADALLDALLSERGLLPAPAQTEFQRVAALRGAGFDDIASDLLGKLEEAGLEVIPYDRTHAAIAARAHGAYGKGNGTGGQLNLLDLMVYAVAKDRELPILFTGRDFTSTDAAVHPASRTDG
ncbi:type II toxin-antitoxin system VapC family toxin [Sphingomonas sp. SUN039]|uniref:type II toxin-antitoxin system VapC family toxin n=1 Tax=Sphingomonas sp. SUN039 TaxID=2937787 RepID=UPI002164E452|nr:type II toxin-antitoxin system VapC family toxin [Sphingomonas sp. SUN039]UVO54941.1 type II toxin-antitoxin system VapC family toxin [Sphingomonas sp. SUN039]